MHSLLLCPLIIVALSATAIASTSNLQWPYPLNIYHQEGLLFEESSFLIISRDCTPRDNTTVAAQWVRTAYHDMATYNIDAGTGGLDASIKFELKRPENVGSGMALTFDDFKFFQRPFTNTADLLAMSVVLAYGSCGGPKIPFRAGRIEATEAGPPGVPEPQQSIESHTESFRRQGFSQSEMIALVACGHTIGGVRNSDFPTVRLENDVEVGLFTGRAEYAHEVVTGYLQGTTPNPLVTSPNITMRSDERIFASDGNVTMQSLNSRDLFDKTCSSLLERMINTVPKGVSLTDVIEPIEDKLGKTRLYPSNTVENRLDFTTSIRILDPPPNASVNLLWSGRRGESCLTSDCIASPSFSVPIGNSTGLGVLRGITTARTYNFQASIDATESMSKFWFEVLDPSSGERRTIDNQGKYYEINNADFLFDAGRSNRTIGSTDIVSVTVAVRTDAGIPTGLHISTFNVNNVHPPFFTPIWDDVPMTLDGKPSMSGYTFYSTTLPQGTSSFDIYGTLNSVEFVQEYVETSEIRTFVVTES